MHHHVLYVGNMMHIHLVLKDMFIYPACLVYVEMTVITITPYSYQCRYLVAMLIPITQHNKDQFIACSMRKHCLFNMFIRIRVLRKSTGFYLWVCLIYCWHTGWNNKWYDIWMGIYSEKTYFICKKNLVNIWLGKQKFIAFYFHTVKW